MVNTFEANCGGVRAPVKLSYTTAAITIILCLVTVSGNLLVCLAVFINPNKDLRNPFNYFVVNLAIADLIAGCVTEPVSVYYHFREALGGPINVIELKSVHIAFFISCTTSVLNLSLLAFERYIAIVSPVKYRLMFSFPRFLSLALLVWLASASLTTVYFFTAFLLYAFIFINIAVGWTMAVFIFTYVKILRKFKQRLQDLSTTSGNSTLDRNRYNVQLTKTYIIMLSIFLVCFTPACILIYTMNWCKSCNCLTIHYLRDTTITVVLLSSALNPFLYAFRFGNFRRAILHILRSGIRSSS